MKDRRKYWLDYLGMLFDDMGSPVSLVVAVAVFVWLFFIMRSLGK